MNNKLERIVISIVISVLVSSITTLVLLNVIKTKVNFERRLRCELKGQLAEVKCQTESLREKFDLIK